MSSRALVRRSSIREPSARPGPRDAGTKPRLPRSAARRRAAVGRNAAVPERRPSACAWPAYAARGIGRTDRARGAPRPRRSLRPARARPSRDGPWFSLAASGAAERRGLLPFQAGTASTAGAIRRRTNGSTLHRAASEPDLGHHFGHRAARGAPSSVTSARPERRGSTDPRREPHRLGPRPRGRPPARSVRSPGGTVCTQHSRRDGRTIRRPARTGSTPHSALGRPYRRPARADTRVGLLPPNGAAPGAANAASETNPPLALALASSPKTGPRAFGARRGRDRSTRSPRADPAGRPRGSCAARSGRDPRRRPTPLGTSVPRPEPRQPGGAPSSFGRSRPYSVGACRPSPTNRGRRGKHPPPEPGPPERSRRAPLGPRAISLARNLAIAVPSDTSEFAPSRQTGRCTTAPVERCSADGNVAGGRARSPRSALPALPPCAFGIGPSTPAGPTTAGHRDGRRRRVFPNRPCRRGRPFAPPAPRPRKPTDPLFLGWERADAAAAATPRDLPRRAAPTTSPVRARRPRARRPRGSRDRNPERGAPAAIAAIGTRPDPWPTGSEAAARTLRSDRRPTRGPALPARCSTRLAPVGRRIRRAVGGTRRPGPGPATLRRAPFCRPPTLGHVRRPPHPLARCPVGRAGGSDGRPRGHRLGRVSPRRHASDPDPKPHSSSVSARSRSNTRAAPPIRWFTECRRSPQRSSKTRDRVPSSARPIGTRGRAATRVGTRGSLGSRAGDGPRACSRDDHPSGRSLRPRGRLAAEAGNPPPNSRTRAPRKSPIRSPAARPPTADGQLPTGPGFLRPARRRGVSPRPLATRPVADRLGSRGRIPRSAGSPFDRSPLGARRS